METIGNNTAVLFPIVSNCFHFSCFVRHKLLHMSYLSGSADRKIVVVPFGVFTFLPETF
jgi:hypothetical protein